LQGFLDDEIEKAFGACDDHWDEWAWFVPDAIQPTPKNWKQIILLQNAVISDSILIQECI
jgi:hypothetical protein